MNIWQASEQGVPPVKQAFKRLTQIVEEMPPVCDL
jgi:hypothetical protein